MSFASEYAPRIWDYLYTVFIPDHLTYNPDYVKKFGTRITENKSVDKMLSTNLTTVKIPIITILKYYSNGLEIQIPSRSDMITMHKDIELYLLEWRTYINNSVHGPSDAQTHKNLIFSLEKLSKYIYNKANGVEVIDNLLLSKKMPFGLLNPIQRKIEENKVVAKPDYEGISNLIKKKNTVKGGGGRF